MRGCVIRAATGVEGYHPRRAEGAAKDRRDDSRNRRCPRGRRGYISRQSRRCRRRGQEVLRVMPFTCECR